MARTFAEGLDSFATAIQDRRRLAKENSDSALDRAVKLAELQSKGFTVSQQSAPRRVLGIPMGTKRSLSLSYDPTQNPDYQDKQLEHQKTRLDMEKTRRDIASYDEPLPGAGTGKNEESPFVRVAGKVVRNPAYIKQTSDGLTPGQRTAKDKATNEIFETREANKVRRGVIDKALEGAETIPQGWLGKVQMGAAKALGKNKGLVGVNDKMIEDAQEMKMALTSGTLAETAFTKGAISDAEMFLFKQASANDDFNSPAIRPVLAKLKAFLDADEAGKYGAYQKNYGEDPRTWFDDAENIPEFATEEEADASGYKGFALIGGRKAEIK